MNTGIWTGFSVPTARWIKTLLLVVVSRCYLSEQMPQIVLELRGFGMAGCIEPLVSCQRALTVNRPGAVVVVNTRYMLINSEGKAAVVTWASSGTSTGKNRLDPLSTKFPTTAWTKETRLGMGSVFGEELSAISYGPVPHPSWLSGVPTTLLFAHRSHRRKRKTSFPNRVV